jgi:hypothetical protein
MNKYLAKITPELSLRTGLGVMYLYSGIDILMHPTAWFWAVRPVLKLAPAVMQTPTFMKQFLISQGVVEILFALVLLAWFLPKKFPKWVAALTTLEMAAILVMIPIDAVTFRDFGLLGGALALFLILNGGLNFVSGTGRVKEMPKEPERKPGEGPLVQTFDQFIGKK